VTTRQPRFGTSRGGEAVLLFGVYLVLVIALPLILSAAIAFQALPRGRCCPNCAQATIPVVSRAIRALLKIVPGLTLQRRWCPTCSWDGYSRQSSLRVAPAYAGAPAPARQTQPVRTLELGGRPWHVMLEYWRERGRFYGRLLFVGPSGKLWCDPLAAFHGTTHHDVLGQALALSDRLLTYRLREVISG
jgi:hypothetical protein